MNNTQAIQVMKDLEVIAITPYPIGINYKDYVPHYCLLKLEIGNQLPTITMNGRRYHYEVIRYFETEKEACDYSKKNKIKNIGEIKF